MLGPPVGLLVNLAALIVDRPKGYAIAGLIISGLTCGLFIVPLLLSALGHR